MCCGWILCTSGFGLLLGWVQDLLAPWKPRASLLTHEACFSPFSPVKYGRKKRSLIFATPAVWYQEFILSPWGAISFLLKNSKNWRAKRWKSALYEGHPKGSIRMRPINRICRLFFQPSQQVQFAEPLLPTLWGHRRKEKREVSPWKESSAKSMPPA